ncbi:flagellin, partial [Escherichia sp. E4385]
DTLGMTGFNIASTLDVTTLKASATTYDVDKGYTYDVNKVTDTKAPSPTTATDIVQDSNGNLYAKEGAKYHALHDDGKGNFTFDSTVDNTTTATAGGAPTSVVGNEVYDHNVAATVPPGCTLKDDGQGNYYLDDGNGNITEATLSKSYDSNAGTSKVVVTAGKNVTNTADPLKTIDAALSQVDKLRSGLGVVQNRFDSVISNLNNTVNNLTESRSRILDADFASEVSNMSRANILQSAGTSVLAQANQIPQNILQLLR